MRIVGGRCHGRLTWTRLTGEMGGGSGDFMSRLPVPLALTQACCAGPSSGTPHTSLQNRVQYVIISSIRVDTSDMQLVMVGYASRISFWCLIRVVVFGD